MNGRIVAGAVIVLVLVVGAIFLIIGSQNGGDSDRGTGTQDSAPADISGRVLGAIAVS